MRQSSIILLTLIMALISFIGCEKNSIKPEIKTPSIGLYNEIKFKINGIEYKYAKGCGYRSYPYGYYIPAYDYTTEQYVITGSKTTSDCYYSSNTIDIIFRNQSDWYLEVLFRETGSQIPFWSSEYDLSILDNIDDVGQQMSASIPGPIISVIDSNYTLSDLSFSVERIDVPSKDSTKYLTHNTGNLSISIFENGNIGHLYGYSGTNKIGVGVRFKGNIDAMFSSGFIMGSTSRGSVNGHIGSYGIDYDLKKTQDLEGFYASLPYWDQITKAVFSDSLASIPYGITMEQNSFSKTGENGMIIKYRLYGNDISYDDLFVGIFADWDVGGGWEYGGSNAYNLNLGGYDLFKNMAYQYVENGFEDPNYYGIIALDGMSGARVTIGEGNYSTIRDSSFLWISTLPDEPIISTGDYRTWIGSGPNSLMDGDTLDISFAILAGTDLSNLQINADYIIQKYISSSMSIK